MIYFSFDETRVYEKKEEYGYLKAYEASYRSNNSSLSKIIIKSQQKKFFLKKKEVFRKLTKNKKTKTKKQVFLFSL